ncbi:MAG: hypothetical protein KatS3mg114_0713 [Planctomycetaceae bacterium]|nr:MAG: hypothetical protein KatS3mg114_0713 [Planctomycetaceae bacterium]
MGLSSRDYYRESPGTIRWGSTDRSTTVTLIMITVGAFILQVLLLQKGAGPVGGNVSLMEEWFATDPTAIMRGQVWRVVTGAFLHDRHDLLHLLLNMLVLWWFGSLLEGIYGARRWWWFYLGAAAVGGVAHTLWGWWRGQSIPAVGASGAIMAVLMLYACHFPQSRIYLFGVLPIEARWLVAAYAFFDLYPLLMELQRGMPVDRIAHVIHLTGLAYGWGYYQWGKRAPRGWTRESAWGSTLRRSPRRVTVSRDWMPRWQSFLRWFRDRVKLRRPSLRVYKPEDELWMDDEELEAAVDRILAKIHEHGSESLTAQEREILTCASERYKRRV